MHLENCPSWGLEEVEFTRDPAGGQAAVVVDSFRARLALTDAAVCSGRRRRPVPGRLAEPSYRGNLPASNCL